MTNEGLGSVRNSIGHKWLGSLPGTKRWREVVASLDRGVSVAQIAAASSAAAAPYVYCGDGTIRRGGSALAEMGRDWRSTAGRSC